MEEWGLEKIEEELKETDLDLNSTKKTSNFLEFLQENVELLDDTKTGDETIRKHKSYHKEIMGNSNLNNNNI